MAAPPLQGIRVLDAGMLYAGPLIATLLADHGADVVKVEPPGGDVYRDWPAMWAIVGRGKRSCTLDTRTPEGRGLFLRLVAEVDVVVENLPAALAAERGLTPAAMREVKPSVVVVSASGFGGDGPYAGRPANGTVGEAFAGLTALTGAPDGPPQLPDVPVGDGVAAAFGAFGALAGVVRVLLRTSEGATVDVTVYEPLLHVLGTSLSDWRPGTAPPTRTGGELRGTLRGTFRTADGGWIAVSASTARQRQSIDELVGGDTDVPLRDRMLRWLATLSRADAAAALDRARIPATPVHDLSEVAADPQVVHRASLTRVDGFVVPRPVPVIDGSTRDGSTPALGDATDAVLGGWLGIGPDELASLRARGVV